MHIDIETCRPDELSALLVLLDNEFIFTKGRQLSLGVRFPHIFNLTNLDNIYLVKIKNSISSVIAVRQFEWITQGQVWLGAMIGMVFTRPEYRGQGLASLVMKSIQARLSEIGIDFAVLWTTIPEFYQRLGWILEDKGVLGKMAQPNTSLSNDFVIPKPLDTHTIQWIDSIRSKWVSERVVRSEVDYKVLPVPVHSVDVFLYETREQLGYALVGKLGETGYVYELVGHPATFHYLWYSIIAHYCQLYINNQQDSLINKWLVDRGQIIWTPQHQTMWLQVSQRAKDMSVGWYIPYFDRI